MTSGHRENARKSVFFFNIKVIISFHNLQFAQFSNYDDIYFAVILYKFDRQKYYDHQLEDHSLSIFHDVRGEQLGRLIVARLYWHFYS